MNSSSHPPSADFIAKKWFSHFVQITFARGVTAIGMFLLSVDIGNRFGAEALGSFTLWLSVTIIAGLFSRIGIDSCLTKLVAGSRLLGDSIAIDEEEKYPVSFAWRRSLIQSLAVSSFVALLVIVATKALMDNLPPFAIWLFLSIPGLTLLGIVAGYARGRQFNTRASIIDVGGIGAVTFVIIFILRQVDVESDLGLIALLFCALNTGVGLICAFLCYWDIGRHFPCGFKPDFSNVKAFHKDQFHFLYVIVGAFVMQAGAFPLGAPALDDRTIGLLRGAERLSVLIVFPTIALNSILAGQVASSFGKKNKKAMLQAFRINGWACFILSLATAIPIIFFARPLLGLFGAEFVAAEGFLVILCLAQILIASSSPILTALNFSNNGRLSSVVTTYTLLFGAIFFPILSFKFEGYGFAVAYLIVAIVKMVVSYCYMRKVFF